MTLLCSESMIKFHPRCGLTDIPPSGVTYAPATGRRREPGKDKDKDKEKTYCSVQCVHRQWAGWNKRSDITGCGRC